MALHLSLLLHHRPPPIVFVRISWSLQAVFKVFHMYSVLFFFSLATWEDSSQVHHESCRGCWFLIRLSTLHPFISWICSIYEPKDYCIYCEERCVSSVHFCAHFCGYLRTYNGQFKHNMVFLLQRGFCCFVHSKVKFSVNLQGLSRGVSLLNIVCASDWHCDTVWSVCQ